MTTEEGCVGVVERSAYVTVSCILLLHRQFLWSLSRRLSVRYECFPFPFMGFLYAMIVASVEDGCASDFPNLHFDMGFFLERLERGCCEYSPVLALPSLWHCSIPYVDVFVVLVPLGFRSIDWVEWFAAVCAWVLFTAGHPPMAPPSWTLGGYCFRVHPTCSRPQYIGHHIRSFTSSCSWCRGPRGNRDGWEVWGNPVGYADCSIYICTALVWWTSSLNCWKIWDFG